ncbi:MAG: hypothetical protein HRT44_00605 [Bdellovibrionales bacterium]|nr:hypothetical protein [Bdellovibrionales bacterium]NQZ17751.1 hypothetical protein [Bdellovibrionales bacterium]
MGSTNILKSLCVAVLLMQSLHAEAFFQRRERRNCGSDEEFNCMVATINGEARGESNEGMLVVGKALKTRKIRGYRGTTICGISRRSFAPKTFARSRTSQAVQARIINAALAACASGDAGITHFHSFRRKYAVSWARQFQYVGKVGGHWLFNAPMSIKVDFEDVAFERPLYNDSNFLTETDMDLLDTPAEEALEIYTSEDDAYTEEILAQPVDNSISI